MHPLIVVSDPTDATVIVDKIKNSPSFDNLKDEVKSILANGSLNNMTPFINVDNLANYKYVVTETLYQLNDNTEVEQNGLQIIENQKVGKEVKFKIRNYKKRYVTIYAHKFNAGQLTNTPIKNTNGTWDFVPYEWVTSGEFSWTKAWQQIFDGQVEEQIIEDSELFAVNTDNAEKIHLKCYGLGIADGDFPVFGSEDYNRGALALARTSVMDYVVPIVEVITGVKDIAKSGDLRGRPNDDPLMKLFNRYFDKFKTSSSLYNEILDASNNGKKEDALKAIWNQTKTFIADEDNAKLYLDLVKQKANLSNAVLSNFKKALYTYSMLKTAGDITGTSVNIAEAVYATISSKWTTEFRINVDGTLTPTEGLVAYYPFNGNVDDESGFNINGSIVGNISLAADRKGNSSKAYSFDGNSGNYISIPTTSVSDLNNLSLCAWVKPTQDGGFIISAGRDIENGSFRLTNGFFGTQVLYNGVNGSGDTSSLGLNTWSFVVGTLNGQNSKYYVNGELVGSETISSLFSTSLGCHSLLIGRHSTYCDPPPNYYPYPFKGLIDDVRIYDRPLSQSEIQDLYNE